MKNSLTTSKAIAATFALLLLLTACGGKTAESSTTTDEGQALTENVETAPQATGVFDAPWKAHLLIHLQLERAPHLVGDYPVQVPLEMRLLLHLQMLV